MLKLNTPENKLVIQELIHFIWGTKPAIKDIKILNDGHVKLFDKNLLYWDKHYHYDDPKKQPIVDYLFLKAVEEILEIEFHDNRTNSRFSKNMINL